MEVASPVCGSRPNGDYLLRYEDTPTGFSRQLPTLDDVFFKILDDEKEDRYASAH